MAQLMPLTVSLQYSTDWFYLSGTKQNQIWYWLTQVVLDKGPLSVCVCVNRVGVCGCGNGCNSEDWAGIGMIAVTARSFARLLCAEIL